MAGCYDVISPPAFYPFIRIDFPARVIKDCINGHDHKERQGRADMDREKERQDREQPRRADGLYGVERKTRPRGRLDGAVMAFMGPFK